MIRWGLAILVLAAVGAGAYLEGGRRAESAAAAREEQARLDAVKVKRQVEEADTKTAQEIIRLKADAQRYKAEATRLRTAAATAAKEVRTVHDVGTKLVESGSTDEIMAALRARGYHPERCRPLVAAPPPLPVQTP